MYFHCLNTFIAWNFLKKGRSFSMKLFTPLVMNSKFVTTFDIWPFYLPTLTKPFLLKTTIPAWLSVAFFISLYIRAESTSRVLSSGMKILSSKRIRG